MLDRAVDELTKVTGTEGYSGWQAWFFLGAAQLKASRFKEGAAAFEKALAAKPDNGPAEGLLAWCYVGLKDTANFKLHGANARNLGFKDPELMKRLSQIEAGETFKDDKAQRWPGQDRALHDEAPRSSSSPAPC